MRAGSKRDRGPESPPLFRSIVLSVACAQTLRTLTRAAAIGALTAVTRPLAHGALARSTTYVALHSVFSHYALYGTAFDGAEAATQDKGMKKT